MADLSPFLNAPEQLIEKIGELSEEIKKLEVSKERAKTKLRAIMAEKEVVSLVAQNYEARIEKREGGPDFSRKGVLEAFGEDTVRDMEKTLPKRADVEALVVRPIKKGIEDEPNPTGKAKLEEINKFFTK
jgi:hypothetical protein